MSKLTSNQPLRDYGLNILNNGFNLIPIKHKTKVPSLADWSTFETTPAHISKWSSNGRGNAGIGILTKYNPFVDIDVIDEDVASSIMEWCVQNYGRGIIRTGQQPKIGIMYRTEDPFPKVQSSLYQSPDGKTHKLEILGDGQQVVCIGIHPKTGKHFRFNGRADITNTASNDLPILTEQDAHDIIEAFAEMIPADWEVKRNASQVDDSDDEFINITPPCDITDDELIEYMRHVPADDDGYEGWYRMGAALWHQYAGSDHGFDIWHEWSQSDVEGYLGTSEKQMRQKWKSFDWRTKKRKPYTFASIMKQVNDGVLDDLEVDIMDKYLKRFALLPNDRIADLEGHARSQQDYGGLSKAGVSMLLPEDTFKPPRSKKDHHVIERWQFNPAKIIVAGFEYGIGKPMVFEAERALWVNTYVPPMFPDTTEDSKLHIFHEHMDYLFPNTKDRELFYQWMANRVQDPAHRIKFVPLHISKHHGTGRGFIADLMAHMVGFNNLQSAKMKELAGEGQGQFNTFLNSAVCVLHEVRERGKKFEVSDKVRDTLDADFLKVTAKRKTAIMKEISCSFLMFSNHFDALALTEDDRRIWAIAGPNHIKDEKYYNRLYACLNDPEFLMQVYGYLMHLDISSFNRGMRAPDYSGMRHRLIENTETEEDVVIAALLEDMPFKIALRDQIFEWAEYAFPSSSLNQRSINKILDNEGCRRLHRLRWDKNPNCIPIQLAGEKLTNNPRHNRKIRNELEKTQAIIDRMKMGEMDMLEEDYDDLI